MIITHIIFLISFLGLRRCSNEFIDDETSLFTSNRDLFNELTDNMLDDSNALYPVDPRVANHCGVEEIVGLKARRFEIESLLKLPKFINEFERFEFLTRDLILYPKYENLLQAILKDLIMIRSRSTGYYVDYRAFNDFLLALLNFKDYDFLIDNLVRDDKRNEILQSLLKNWNYQDRSEFMAYARKNMEKVLNFGSAQIVIPYLILHDISVELWGYEFENLASAVSLSSFTKFLIDQVGEIDSQAINRFRYYFDSFILSEVVEDDFEAVFLDLLLRIADKSVFEEEICSLISSPVTFSETQKMKLMSLAAKYKRYKVFYC